MTVHESSLSPSIHAVLAAELGMEEKAVEMYQRTARLDLDNYNNDTEDGLHITSMTGSWLAIVQGFAQMKTDHQQLKFAPFYQRHGQPTHSTLITGIVYYLLKLQQTKWYFHFTRLPAIPLTVYDQKYTLKDRLVLPIRKEEVHV